MERVMTGVGIEPTTYGLKERRAATTGDNDASGSGAVRNDSEQSETPESGPKSGAVSDGPCMAATPWPTRTDWRTIDGVNWFRGRP